MPYYTLLCGIPLSKKTLENSYSNGIKLSFGRYLEFQVHLWKASQNKSKRKKGLWVLCTVTSRSILEHLPQCVFCLFDGNFLFYVYYTTFPVFILLDQLASVYSILSPFPNLKYIRLTDLHIAIQPTLKTWCTVILMSHVKIPNHYWRPI